MQIHTKVKLRWRNVFSLSEEDSLLSVLVSESVDDLAQGSPSSKPVNLD